MNRKKILSLLSAAVLVLIASVLALVLTRVSDPYENKILNGVHLAGIDVSGMTKKEAKAALAEKAAAMKSTDFTVLLPKDQLLLSPSDTQVKLNVSRAVSTAFAYGRRGSQEERLAAAQAAQLQPVQIDLLACLSWKEDAVMALLEEYAHSHNTAYSETEITVEGNVPALGEKEVQPDIQGQTLCITLGTPEFTLDVEGLYADILNAYNLGEFQADWSGVQPLKVPEVPDFDALHLRYCQEATDAELDLENGTTIPGTYGHCFDSAKAQAMVNGGEPGQTLRIPFEIKKPEKATEDLYFQDVLGVYTSGHSDKPNIVTNLDLVCKALDGVVLQPGEVFSYNDTVGERTVERGFMYGESFSGFERTRSAGGGVCQGSSVLHVCVLEADLEVIERAPHGLTVGYTPLGQDAAVSWGGPDFRFRNSTNFPIKIVAKNEKQLVKMQLLGTDEKDYYIILEATQGNDEHQIYANCYKQKYSKATGELISRELAVHSAYKYNG